MTIPYLVAWIFSVSMMVLNAGIAPAQTYPYKPVRIVTAEFGGNGDFTARLIAQELSTSLGQQVVVENRPGIVIIPAEIVANAQPDGYTLLSYGTNMWILPLLENTPYDPLRDYSAITLTTRSPDVLVVHPSVPAKSVKELIALAKSSPGTLNYGSSGTGSSTQLGAELFKAMAGVNIVGIKYKGAGPALNDLLGGEVQLMFGSPSSIAPHIISGRLRALAVTSAQPSALFPDLPTMAATGLPGYESGTMQGMWAPANTPAIIINRLNQQVVRVLNQTDVRKRLLSTGVEAVGSSPGQLVTAIRSEMARFGKVIREAQLKLD